MKLGLIETDAHNVFILTGNGVSPAIILIQIGFTVYPLLISVSLIETSFMNQTQDLFLFLFLHMAINMLKKIDQRATNVRKPLNLIILIFAITSTRYGAFMLFKPDGGTLSSQFKDFFSISWHMQSLMASLLNHFHHTGSLFVCLFDLILNVPSTIFQLYRNGSSWVEPVLS